MQLHVAWIERSEIREPVRELERPSRISLRSIRATVIYFPVCLVFGSSKRRVGKGAKRRAHVLNNSNGKSRVGFAMLSPPYRPAMRLIFLFVSHSDPR